jgi:hypothetical protein
MLYQLSYASPPGVHAPGANRPGHPEKTVRKTEKPAHTLSLRMFFGTELKVSTRLTAEQTCGNPWKPPRWNRLGHCDRSPLPASANGK